MYTNVFDCIVTIKQEFLEVGMNEIYLIDPKAKVSRWIEKGIAMVSLSQNFGKIVEAFRKKPSIFIQHCFPVHKVIDLQSYMENNRNSDKETKISETILKGPIFKILEDSKELFTFLDTKKTFSVQVRIMGEMEKQFRRQNFEEVFSAELRMNGYLLNVQNPEMAVTLAIANNFCYIGISDIGDNCSSWSGGIHRFAKEKEQVSRAEFKLLEALEYFQVDLSLCKTAVDLGAAPGGWSRVLLNRGFTVFAVDPAVLNDSLMLEKNLQYFKESAQEFFKRDLESTFDLIVNDMKMDSIDSAKIMCAAIKILKKEGIGIITLKLPKNDIKRKIKSAIKILEQHYTVIGIKQLFSNRSEVTVMIKK